MIKSERDTVAQILQDYVAKTYHKDTGREYLEHLIELWRRDGKIPSTDERDDFMELVDSALNT